MNIAAVPQTGRMPDMSGIALVDEVGVKERAARFQTRSIKKESKTEALKMVLSMIDLPGHRRSCPGSRIRLHARAHGGPWGV